MEVITRVSSLLRRRRALSDLDQRVTALVTLSPRCIQFSVLSSAFIRTEGMVRWASTVSDDTTRDRVRVVLATLLLHAHIVRTNVGHCGSSRFTMYLSVLFAMLNRSFLVA